MSHPAAQRCCDRDGQRNSSDLPAAGSSQTALCGTGDPSCRQHTPPLRYKAVLHRDTLGSKQLPRALPVALSTAPGPHRSFGHRQELLRNPESCPCGTEPSSAVRWQHFPGHLQNLSLLLKHLQFQVEAQQACHEGRFSCRAVLAANPPGEMPGSRANLQEEEAGKRLIRTWQPRRKLFRQSLLLAEEPCCGWAAACEALGCSLWPGPHRWHTACTGHSGTPAVSARGPVEAQTSRERSQREQALPPAQCIALLLQSAQRKSPSTRTALGKQVGLQHELILLRPEEEGPPSLRSAVKPRLEQCNSRQGDIYIPTWKQREQCVTACEQSGGKEKKIGERNKEQNVRKQ